MSLIVTRKLWTPGVTCNNPGDLSVVYGAANAGSWAQSDNLVMAGFLLQFTPTYTTASSTLLINGWPAFPPDPPNWTATILPPNGLTWAGTGPTQLFASLAGGGMTLSASSSGGTLTSLFITAFTSGTSYTIRGSIMFVVGP